MSSMPSREASIRATRSSKYSLIPLNRNLESAGRRVRVNGGGRRLSRTGRDGGDWNPSLNCSSLVNAERQERIASGEMYPELGILQSSRSTRSVADKSSFRNPGNGMRVKESDCRRGADPPKNESGSTGTVSSSENSSRDVSAGNGFSIAARSLPDGEFVTSQSSI